MIDYEPLQQLPLSKGLHKNPHIRYVVTGCLIWVLRTVCQQLSGSLCPLQSGPVLKGGRKK
jgi:hypothetical protein